MGSTELLSHEALLDPYPMDDCDQRLDHAQHPAPLPDRQSRTNQRQRQAGVDGMAWLKAITLRLV